MITLQDKEKKIQDLAAKYSGTQIDTYKGSIYLPYITLPNAKGKGTMMEEYISWLLKESGIDCEWINGTLNYDFLINKKLRIELKTASIGSHNLVVFNQLHFGEEREVDEFLLTIIRPDNNIDMFLIPKKEFQYDRIKVQNQHGKDKENCARIALPYDKLLEELKIYQTNIDNLKQIW